jgi:ATP-dependent Clp protease ATP-binding subunit ClpC
VLSPFFGCSGPTRPCASPLTGGRWLSLTPRSKHVLELASKEAERRQQAHITPTRILIGILIEGQGLACQILSSRGVRIDDLTATARSVLDDSPDV